MEQKRNIGIDLLKVVSMLMIIMIHLIGHGNVLATQTNNYFTYNSVLLIRIVVNCAVNCYAIITGYLCCDNVFKINRIIKLWIKVVFYTLSIACIVMIVTKKINISSFVGACLPVTFNQYWYFTSYFALFFIMPFLNKLISIISQKENKLLLLGIVFLFSVLPTISSRDIFSLNGGGSVWWLMCCYLVGAYLKKYGIKKWHNGAYIVIFILINLATYCLYRLTETTFLANYIDKTFWMIYTSPSMLFAAICLFMVFLNINIENKVAIKVLRILSTSSFSVYLIHDNSLIRKIFITNKFSFLAHLNPLVVVLILILLATIIYLVCTLLDICCSHLLDRSGIYGIAKKIEEKVITLYKKVN